MKQLTVIVADDHELIAEGVRALLEIRMDIAVVGQAKDGQKAVELCRAHQPDIAILDVAMPGLNGMDATREIRTVSPATRVIGLSMHAEAWFVQSMLDAGASAYLLKDCMLEDLMKAVDASMRNETYMSAEVAETLQILAACGAAAPRQPLVVLTPRERQTLQFIAEGKTIKQISARLRISHKTAETYREHLMEKLNLHSVAELTKYAIREGLTMLEK